MGWEDDDEVTTTYGSIQLFGRQQRNGERARIRDFVTSVTCYECADGNPIHEICRMNVAILNFIGKDEEE